MNTAGTYIPATHCDLERAHQYGPIKKKEPPPIPAAPKGRPAVNFLGNLFCLSCLRGTHQLRQPCLFQLPRAFEQRRVNNAMLRYETQRSFLVSSFSPFAVEAEMSRPTIVPDLNKGGGGGGGCRGEFGFNVCYDALGSGSSRPAVPSHGSSHIHTGGLLEYTVTTRCHHPLACFSTIYPHHYIIIIPSWAFQQYYTSPTLPTPPTPTPARAPASAPAPKPPH